MFSSLTIRAKVWLIVIASLIAIVGLSISLLSQAKIRFVEQIEQGSVNQVRMMHDLIRGIHQRVQAGELSEAEGKSLGRFVINNTEVNERNYMLLYHRIGQLLAHPVRNVNRPLDTDADVRASLAAQDMPASERLTQRGYPSRDPYMTEIIRSSAGSDYSGFFQYLYYPDEVFGYRVLAVMDDEYAHPQAEVRRGYAEHFEPWGWVIVHGIFLDDVNAAFMRWALNSAVIVALILIVLSAGAFFLSRSITGPLLRSRDYMVDIAQGSGDLSRRLAENGNDELADLGRGFNTFVGKLAGIIRQVLETNSEVTRQSAQFAEMIERTAQRSSAQIAETETLASSTTELSSSLADVAGSARTSVEAASEAKNATEKANKAVAQTSNSVVQLSESLSSIQQKVHHMSSHNEKVNTVLDVIRGIAEQTNLLALNAAIEAARAGEQGRGFAVVADEVRSLAQKTQDSTQEINSIIQELESNTSLIVRSMDEGVKMSQDCAATAHSANTLLETVLRSVALITERSQEIAFSVQQQSEVTEEIASSSVKIAGDGRLNAEDYRRCTQYHEEVRSLLASLDQLMRQFKLG